MKRKKSNSVYDIINSLNHSIEWLDVVQWAEKYRKLTKADTRFPGPVRFNKSPYLKEIVNSICESDPAEIITIMKGSQLGFTDIAIVSMLGWVISQNPAAILYITETDKKIKDQVNGIISNMINNSGISHLVGSLAQRKEREAQGRKKRDTGDTSEAFIFNNGKFHSWSGQQIGSLSTFSVKYGFYDEVERYKGIYNNAGEFIEMIEPRHKSFGDSRKLFFISTPEIKQKSNIEPLYDLGDQRKYFIPCKHCGEYINLEWSVDVDEKSKAGIIYKRDGLGNFIERSTEYVCQKCGKSFKKDHLYDMYDEESLVQERKDSGENIELLLKWNPTAQAISKIYKSYGISSMYAPKGFYNWGDMARKWCSYHPIGKPIRVRALQTFINQELGQTFELRTEGIKVKSLQMNTRNYEIGTVPDQLSVQDGNGRIIMLTCAVDLNGIMDDDDSSKDDVRLDYEVKAWCEHGDNNVVSSYSVDAGSIGTFQRVSDKRTKSLPEDRKKYTFRHGKDNSVWDEFEANVLHKVYICDTGAKMKILKAGIDTGSFTIYANEFVSKNHNCISLKGKSKSVWSKIGGSKPYWTKGSQPDLYLVDGDVVKDMLSEKTTLSWNERMKREQPMGFMNFPLSDNGKYTYDGYFVEFEGEKKEIKQDADGNSAAYRWRKKHDNSRNHFFDCAVYNEVVAKIMCRNICDQVKDSEGKKILPTWENFAKIAKMTLSN